MTRSIRKSLVGLLVAGLASCTGMVDNTPGPGGGTGGKTGGSTGGTSGGAGGTSGSMGGTMVTAGTGGAGLTCNPGIPVTTQIPRITTVQYDTVIKDLLGVTTLTTAGNVAPSSFLAPDSAGSLTDISWNGYLTAAEKVAGEVMAGTNKSKFIACDPAATGTAGTTCLQNTITTFGRKAFRRPLTPTEVTSFMRFNSLTPAGTPAEVAEAILYGILASPSFIMLPELAQTPSGSAIQLNSYEIATRLSFLFWNSVPDDMLNAAADATGQLDSKDEIKAQALRLLQSPKAAAVASTFHRYYVGIEPNSHWVNNTVHAPTYSTFTDASYAAAMGEIDSFFQDTLLNGGSFKDLFTSTVGFVTKDTASFYGLTGTYTTTPMKVTLDATKRPGFLTRIGFLSTFAHADTSSPILRGAFINNRVLGIPTGTPDPTFLGMTPPTGTYTTNRAAMEALTNKAPCNTCHTAKVNPPGFVLERYNAVGAWQDKDPLGGDINSTADVMLSVDPAITKTLSTPADMMAEIGKLPVAQHQYAQYWVAFAAARSPNPNDACTVDMLASNMANATYSIANMMADYTQADSFRLRTVGN